ncbi:LCP family protein [Arthrobacter alpinus]|nr:LCP family protein [Arthrobacter alpinus]
MRGFGPRGGHGWAVVHRLQSNVTTAPLDARVPNGNSGSSIEDTGSLQILILGTDTREGKNSQYGTEADSAGAGQSDVMLLMDISPDNSRVSVTSFPRDLMVPIPDCVSATDKKTVPGAPVDSSTGPCRPVPAAPWLPSMTSPG